MNWISELCDLYDKNQDLVGKMKSIRRMSNKGPVDIPLVLLPISHTTVAAQITVTIDEAGNFLYAEPVGEEDRLTMIPVTDKSASRTAGMEPHPLCDNLKYLAGDYMAYYGGKDGKKKDFSEYHERYMEALQQWSESGHNHEKVRAVFWYLRKGCLMKDLIKSSLILLDDHGVMQEKVKLQSVNQADAFVRFRIQAARQLDKQSMEQETGRDMAACWLDRTLQNQFIQYYYEEARETGLSYLTGTTGPISFLHPKKIRNEGDGAKLISSNDEQCFTFRGRFATKAEAFSIGYEDSQKAHNALKWIIRKQGYHWDSLCVVVWESDLKPIPDLRADTDAIADTYEGWRDEQEDSLQYLGTDEAGASRFANAMRGYGKILGLSSRTVLLAMDAATPGRLAMTEYKVFSSSNYLNHIQYWHETCEWEHVKYKNKARFMYSGIPGIGTIAEILYGSEQNGALTLNGKNRMYAEVFKRLLPCISEKRPIPEDMVRLAVQRASSPVSYHEWYNWERTLALACSFVKKHRYEKIQKEEWKVALDKSCNKRDYLYGRLLAVADRVEYRTYEKEERRETNAQRYMAAFAQRPMSTWKVIEEKLEPYWMRLKPGERTVYKNLLDEIYDRFTVEAYAGDERLDGLYLLGFHSQAIALRNSRAGQQEMDHTQETAID